MKTDRHRGAGPDVSERSHPLTCAVQRWMRHRIVAQFSRFLAAGAVGTAAQYLILAMLVEFARVQSVAASSVGMIAGTIVNYLTNRRFVFQSDARHLPLMTRFLSVALAAFLANVVSMAALTELWGLPYLPAQVVATGTVTLITFTAHRAWTFVERAA